MTLTSALAVEGGGNRPKGGGGDDFFWMPSPGEFAAIEVGAQTELLKSYAAVIVEAERNQKFDSVPVNGGVGKKAQSLLIDLFIQDARAQYQSGSCDRADGKVGFIRACAGEFKCLAEGERCPKMQVCEGGRGISCGKIFGNNTCAPLIDGNPQLASASCEAKCQSDKQSGGKDCYAEAASYFSSRPRELAAVTQNVASLCEGKSDQRACLAMQQTVRKVNQATRTGRQGELQQQGKAAVEKASDRDREYEDCSYSKQDVFVMEKSSGCDTFQAICKAVVICKRTRLKGTGNVLEGASFSAMCRTEGRGAEGRCPTSATSCANDDTVLELEDFKKKHKFGQYSAAPAGNGSSRSNGGR